jgi:hypothetical protein
MVNPLLDRNAMAMGLLSAGPTLMAAGMRTTNPSQRGTMMAQAGINFANQYQSARDRNIKLAAAEKQKTDRAAFSDLMLKRPDATTMYQPDMPAFGPDIPMMGGGIGEIPQPTPLDPYPVVNPLLAPWQKEAQGAYLKAYPEEGGALFGEMFAKQLDPPDRNRAENVFEDQQGFKRYRDTGERVLPDLEVAPEEDSYSWGYNLTTKKNVRVTNAEIRASGGNIVKEAPPDAKVYEPHSDVAKAQADYDELSKVLTSNHPTMLALASIAAGEDDDDKYTTKAEIFKRAGVLRKEYNNLSKDFTKIRDAYGRIIAASRNPSGAGDIAMIFNFMKMLDPGSTVREGEFATAENSAGVTEKLRNLYNKITRGVRLTKIQREDFLDQSAGLYDSQLGAQQATITRYSRLAERAMVAPADVVHMGKGLLPAGVAYDPDKIINDALALVLDFEDEEE